MLLSSRWWITALEKSDVDERWSWWCCLFAKKCFRLLVEEGERSRNDVDRWQLLSSTIVAVVMMSSRDDILVAEGNIVSIPCCSSWAEEDMPWCLTPYSRHQRSWRETVGNGTLPPLATRWPACLFLQVIKLSKCLQIMFTISIMSLLQLEFTCMMNCNHDCCSGDSCHW